MCRSKMSVCTAVLCLACVCILAVGCEGPAAQRAETAAKRLGPYELNEDGFILNWLVVGSFPNHGDRPDNRGFHVDYLKNYGGEANHVPANEMEITEETGTKAKWTQYNSAYPEINFFSIEHLYLYYGQDDILTYSACWLECEKDMEVEIRVGSDDGYKLWIDHKLIGEERVYRSAAIDQEIYPIKLSKGTNLVLIKVDQDWGAYQFMMRVMTPDGKRASGIKVLN